MTLAISIFTISTFAFLVSVFMHNFGYGMFFALLLHVVWFMIFGSGFILPFSQIFINYFWSVFLFAVVGWCFAVMMKVPALLNGAYYTQVFNDAHKTRKLGSRGEFELSRNRTFGIFFLVLLLILIGHIVYELNIDGWPKWGGGLFLFLFNGLAWLAFWGLFAGMNKKNLPSALFNSPNPNAEVIAITFHMWFMTTVYALTYWISQAVDCPDWDHLSPNVTMGECDWFINDQWYFWLSLIVGGAILILWVIPFGLVARQRSKKWTYEKLPEEQK